MTTAHRSKPKPVGTSGDPGAAGATLDPKLYCDSRAHAMYLLDQFGHEQAELMVKDARQFCEEGTHSYTFHTQTLKQLDEMKEIA